MAPPIVFLLDDEPGVVAALGRILRANGFVIRAWTSAAEFLNAHDNETPDCLVTDARMPGISGLEVQRVLLRLLGTFEARRIVVISDAGGPGMAGWLKSHVQRYNPPCCA